MVDGSLEHSPLAPIKIIGPRGAGKTTLLHLAGAAARRQGIHVIVNARLRSLAPGSAIGRRLRDGMDWRERIPLELSRLFKLGWGFGPANASAEREQQEQDTFEMGTMPLTSRFGLGASCFASLLVFFLEIIEK